MTSGGGLSGVDWRGCEAIFSRRGATTRVVASARAGAGFEEDMLTVSDDNDVLQDNSKLAMELARCPHDWEQRGGGSCLRRGASPFPFLNRFCLPGWVSKSAELWQCRRANRGRGRGRCRRGEFCSPPPRLARAGDSDVLARASGGREGKDTEGVRDSRCVVVGGDQQNVDDQILKLE